MADSSTSEGQIPDLIAGECWARHQLHNGIRYVSVASKLRNSVSSVKAVLSIILVIFYSTADCSTAAGRISIPFAGGCWAGRQLSNGIRYVSLASRVRKSLSSVERIFIVALAIFNLTADYSTAAGQTLMLFAGGCWARRQLRSSIMYGSVVSIPRKSLTLVGVVFTMLVPW